MNIAVLMGSPNERGSTYLLADAFRRGAEERGHEVQLNDVAHARLQPCGGCIACGYDGPCVQKDDQSSSVLRSSSSTWGFKS